MIFYERCWTSQADAQLLLRFMSGCSSYPPGRGLYAENAAYQIIRNLSWIGKDSNLLYLQFPRGWIEEVMQTVEPSPQRLEFPLPLRLRAPGQILQLLKTFETNFPRPHLADAVRVRARQNLASHTSNGYWRINPSINNYARRAYSLVLSFRVT
jgi:hypothetical protein